MYRTLMVEVWARSTSDAKRKMVREKARNEEWTSMDSELKPLS